MFNILSHQFAAAFTLLAALLLLSCTNAQSEKVICGPYYTTRAVGRSKCRKDMHAGRYIYCTCPSTGCNFPRRTSMSYQQCVDECLAEPGCTAISYHCSIRVCNLHLTTDLPSLESATPSCQNYFISDCASCLDWGKPVKPQCNMKPLVPVCNTDTTCAESDFNGACTKSATCADCTCQFEYHPASYVCRAPIAMCDIEEKCSGSTSVCPSDKYAGASTKCGFGGSCDGTTAYCPCANDAECTSMKTMNDVQYIQVLALSFGVTLHLCEVKAFDSAGVNVAQGKETSIVIPYHNGNEPDPVPSSRAVDGGTSGAGIYSSTASGGSCTRSLGGSTDKPFWEVDLGSLYAIRRLVIFGRDNPAERLAGFKVLMVRSDRKMIWMSPLLGSEQVHTFEFFGECVVRTCDAGSKICTSTYTGDTYVCPTKTLTVSLYKNRTSTSSASISFTYSNTPVRTDSETLCPTRSSTASWWTPTSTYTIEPKNTLTATPTGSMRHSASLTQLPTATPSSAQSITAAMTRSPSWSASVFLTASMPVTPSSYISETFSQSVSHSYTFVGTETPTLTLSSTSTQSQSFSKVVVVKRQAMIAKVMQSVLPEATAKTVATAAPASAVAGGFAAPAAASQYARVAALISGVMCVASEDDDDPDSAEHPFQFLFNISADMKLPRYSGACISDVLVLYVAAGVQLWMHVAFRRDRAPKFVLKVVSFWGAVVPVVQGYFIPAACISASTLFFSSHRTDVELAVVVFAVVSICVLLAWPLYSTLNLRKYVKWVKTDLEAKSNVDFECISKTSLFMETNEAFFGDCRDPSSILLRMLFFEEILSACLIAVCAGIRPDDGGCKYILLSILAICILHFVYVAILRPYSRRLPAFFSIFAAVTTLFIAIFGLMILSDPSKMSLLAYPLLIQSFMFLLQSVVSWSWAFILRSKRKALAADEKEKPLLAAVPTVATEASTSGAGSGGDDANPEEVRSATGFRGRCRSSAGSDAGSIAPSMTNPLTHGFTRISPQVQREIQRESDAELMKRSPATPYLVMSPQLDRGLELSSRTRTMFSKAARNHPLQNL